MNYILDILRTEHRMIMNLLNKLRSEGMTSADAVNELIAARNLLLQHLRKEDEIIFPVLYKGAEKNREFAGKLEHHDEAMVRITDKVLEYFSTYSDGKNGGNFTRDTKTVYEMLKTRILNEETILFPEYERLCDGEKKHITNEKEKNVK
jgi:iron-sulfur cluster repair protein YtfE (RIC family)